MKGIIVMQINGPVQRDFTTYPKIQISKFIERKIIIIFLPINLNMCFGCSKEQSQ